MKRLTVKQMCYAIVMLLMFSFALMCTGHPVHAASNSHKTAVQACKAYKKFLSQKKIQVLKKGTKYWYTDTKTKRVNAPTPAKDLRFRLIYLNNDDIPELVVRDHKYDAFALFAYKHGKVVRIGQGCYGFLGGNEPFYYRYKSGLLYIEDGCNLDINVYYYNESKLTLKYIFCNDQDDSDPHYTTYQRVVGKNSFGNPTTVEISKQTYNSEIDICFSLSHASCKRMWLSNDGEVYMYPNTKEHRKHNLTLNTV